MTKNYFQKDRGDALVWFIVIVAGLWVLWYFTGGPERAQNQSGAFLDPAPIGGTGKTYTIGQ